MITETQKVDVLGLLRSRFEGCEGDFSKGLYLHPKDAKDVHDAVAELISMMGEVLHLWDTDRMSIDAKAAALQDRPEKWRATLARVGGDA